MFQTGSLKIFIDIKTEEEGGREREKEPHRDKFKRLRSANFRQPFHHSRKPETTTRVSKGDPFSEGRKEESIKNSESDGDDDWRIGKIVDVTADVRLESSRVRWDGRREGGGCTGRVT